jgi:hypothetical protein
MDGMKSMKKRSKFLCSAVVMALSPMTVRGTEQILFPAYEDPSDTAYWNTLSSSVSPQVPITTILNPDSGPSTVNYSFYTGFIPTFQANGGRVIGYVDSDTQGTDTQPAVMQPLADVEAEVAQYKSLYPNLNGIFIDDFNASSGELSYYQSLYSYIKMENPNWLVFGNPGTSIGSTFNATTNVLVSFESTHNKYQTYSPSSWQSSYPASRFGNLAYNLPSTAAAISTDLTLAQQDRSGYVYFTDFNGDPTYLNIPTYWSQEVADVKAINAATPTQATYLLTNSGDFNTAANWSTAVPDGVIAEADFLSSATGPATITSATAITLGKIVFNNASNSFTLGGGGTLAMQVSSGSAVVDSQAGTHTISLPISIASNSVFQAESGATLLIAGAVTVSAGESLSTSGAGTVLYQSSATIQNGGSFQLSAGSHLTTLNLNATSRVSLNLQTASPTIATLVGSLSIAAGSTLDLRNGELIVNNGNLAVIGAELKSGYGNGSWNGAGILSSTAVADSTHLHALGLIQNSATGSPSGTALYSSFGSAMTIDTDVLLKYTFYGDTNLDGKVDASDYSRIDSGYAAHATGWFNGDFNYDGVINGSDYTLIDNAFNTQGAVITSVIAQPAAEVAPVPEPTGTLAMFSTLALVYRFRRSVGR